MITPDYVLCEDYTYPAGGIHDRGVLPAGSFVRPIDLYYVPKHVKNDYRWRFMDPDTDVFCYTHNGIIVIPRKLLRQK